MSSPNPLDDGTREEKIADEKAEEYVMDATPTLCKWCGEAEGHSCSQCGEIYETKNTERTEEDHYCERCYEDHMWSLTH